jgi:dTDP-4-amino-4,6-dideoxygalactose transaminase
MVERRFMKVPFIDLERQHKPIKKDLMQAFERVLDSNKFILSDEVKKFENEVASYTETKYAIGVSNCTNALLLSLRALGIGTGDEVITTPFTFVATAEVIAILGARPVFCDIDEKTFNIDVNKIKDHISARTRAIIPVHLYGQAADMAEIMDLARAYNLKVIEDMAQAIGAKYKGKMIGNLGDTACISFYVTKNLNALGDAGMILTNDEKLDTKIRAYRVHGAQKKYHHDFLGHNDRLDAMQAAFLNIKLKYLDDWNAKRRQIAKQYDEGLTDVVMTPYISEDNDSVYHQYTIRAEKRDELGNFLNGKGIGTAIHYPVPLHLQPAFRYLGYKEGDLPVAEQAAGEVISLRIQQDLTEEEVDYVIKCVRQFYKK